MRIDCVMKSDLSNDRSKQTETGATVSDEHKFVYGALNFELSAETKRVAKNKDVIFSGKQYDNLFFNQSGWLCRYKTLRDGARQIMDFILPGQIFGLQARFFQRALYSVATITDTTLSIVPVGDIEGIFQTNVIFAQALFWSAVCEFAIMSEHLVSAAQRSAYARVSHLLLELFVRLKTANLVDDMSFHMPLTQEHLGSALGLTNVHVNRTLKSLRDDKLIAIEGKRVTILDFDALARLSEFDNSYLAEAARGLRRERPRP